MSQDTNAMIKYLTSYPWVNSYLGAQVLFNYDNGQKLIRISCSQINNGDTIECTFEVEGNLIILTPISTEFSPVKITININQFNWRGGKGIFDKEALTFEISK